MLIIPSLGPTIVIGHAKSCDRVKIERNFPTFIKQNEYNLIDAERLLFFFFSFSSFFIIISLKMSPAHTNQSLKTTLCFAVEDKVGVLEDCLSCIKAMDISLTRIES